MITIARVKEDGIGCDMKELREIKQEQIFPQVMGMAHKGMYLNEILTIECVETFYRYHNRYEVVPSDWIIVS